jgi:hypothetical protein
VTKHVCPVGQHSSGMELSPHATDAKAGQPVDSEAGRASGQPPMYADRSWICATGWASFLALAEAPRREREKRVEMMRGFMVDC